MTPDLERAARAVEAADRSWRPRRIPRTDDWYPVMDIRVDGKWQESPVVPLTEIETMPSFDCESLCRRRNLEIAIRAVFQSLLPPSDGMVEAALQIEITDDEPGCIVSQAEEYRRVISAAIHHALGE